MGNRDTGTVGRRAESLAFRFLRERGAPQAMRRVVTRHAVVVEQREHDGHRDAAQLQEEQQDVEALQDVIARHREATGSPRAREVLERWDEMLALFWKVIPLPAEAIAKTMEVAKEESEVAVTAGR